jgi:hypothetical protein
MFILNNEQMNMPNLWLVFVDSQSLQCCGSGMIFSDPDPNPTLYLVPVAYHDEI